MYTVSNVKTFRGMEGTGFNVDLLEDGKKVAFVIDDAHGGPLKFQWVDSSAAARMEAFIATQPAHEHHGMMLDADKEILVGDLVNAALVRKELLRKCKGSTLYRLVGQSEGDYWSIKRSYDSAVKVHLQAKYGDKLLEILNERL